MALSVHHHNQEKLLLLLLLCAALTLATAAAGNNAVTYSFPVFNYNTTGDAMVAAFNTSILTPASMLFDPMLSPDFNASEGFLLLADTIRIWRRATGDGDNTDYTAYSSIVPGGAVKEASFNTSFTLAAAAPVSFVVLKNAFPPLREPGGLRGFGNYSRTAGAAEPTTATAPGGLAVVDVDSVQSYGPDESTAGLNVTVSPAPRGQGCAVWVEFDARVHRVSVYVAGVGQARPARALVSVPLGQDGWRWTTETALVGFFAGAIRDVLVGVRDWELTVDRLAGDGKKGAAWWVVLLAVVGSVVAAAAVVTAVVCFVQIQKRRRRGQQHGVDHRPKI